MTGEQFQEGGGASEAYSGPAAPVFSVVEYAIIWSTLYASADGLNAPVRAKIEQYFAEHGVPVEQLTAVAEQAKAMAGLPPAEPPQ